MAVGDEHVFPGFLTPVLKVLLTQLLFPKPPTTFLTMTLRMKTIENIVGKGGNADKKHFLLFPQCFLAFPNQIPIFDFYLFCCLQMLSV